MWVEDDTGVCIVGCCFFFKVNTMQGWVTGAVVEVIEPSNVKTTENEQHKQEQLVKVKLDESGTVSNILHMVSLSR